MRGIVTGGAGHSPRGLGARARLFWAAATFGADRPGRMIAVLTAAGVVSGLGETAIVVLLIALAAGRSLSLGSLSGVVPDGTLTLGALALGAVAVIGFAHWATAASASRVSADVRRTLQGRLVQAWFDAPWAVQAPIPASELQHLVSVDVTGVALGTQVASQAFTWFIHIVILIAAAFAIGPYTVLTLGLALAIAVLAGRPLHRLARRRAATALARQNDVSREVAELGDLTRELRLFGAVPRARRWLETGIADAADQMRRSDLATQLMAPLLRDTTIALLVIGLVVVREVSDVTLSGLGATVLLLLRGLTYAQTLGNSGIQLQQRAVQRARIIAALAAWAPPRAPGTLPLPPGPLAVTVEGASVRYAGAAQDAIRDVSLELHPGELIGVVGPTGAGKSTLAGALLGLLEPTEGRVVVSGVDLREIDPASWHARTAWVGQDPRLIVGTVADNIRFFRTEIDDDAIRRAALDAGLGRELAEWPDGLDHPVGAGRGRLSGGQRQRIAIARALAGRPAIVVLDEPTSALDVEAEVTVRDLLGTLRGHALIVVIAHRLSTLRECDRIAVIERGRLTRLAPPAELQHDESYFRRVLELSRAEPVDPRRAAG